MKTWLKILISVVIIVILLYALGYFFSIFFTSNQNTVFGFDVNSIPEITLEKINFQISPNDRILSFPVCTPSINGKPQGDYLSFNTSAGNFLVKRIYVGNKEEVSKFINGTVVHLADVVRGSRDGDLISSNDKGEVYASFGGNIYSINGDAVLPVLGDDVINSSTSRFDAICPSYPVYANGNWYIGASFSPNKGVLYMIKNGSIMPVKGIEKFDDVSIYATVGSAFVKTIRTIPGLCGNFEPCSTFDMYSLDGDEATPISINGGIGPWKIDKRNYVYAWGEGVGLFIFKDNKPVGKINAPTMRSPNMYSDGKNTYIFDANQADSIVYKINIPQ
ncbi:MAG TPA: hypothetical protein VI937_03675 [Negativicutes bacterium]|nr:hypothetical protein [Negativicutes bacterium]